MEKEIKTQLGRFRKYLRDNSDPGRAVREKKYLKSPHKFFGVPVPLMEKMAKEFKKAHRNATPEEVSGLAQALWESEYHQEKSLAVKLLKQYPGYLDLKSLPMLEGMLSECTGWDHTDGISVHLVGEVLRKDGSAFRYLVKWKDSENVWMRRAALISQILLFREGKGDAGLFLAIAEEMAEEKEFFIRKAMGWSVRELSKADPETAFRFLMRIRGRASGLTLREGARLLPEEMKKKVLGK